MIFIVHTRILHSVQRGTTLGWPARTLRRALVCGRAEVRQLQKLVGRVRRAATARHAIDAEICADDCVASNI